MAARPGNPAFLQLLTRVPSVLPNGTILAKTTPMSYNEGHPTDRKERTMRRNVDVNIRSAFLLLCLGVLVGPPASVWAEQGASGEAAKNEIQEMIEMTAGAKVSIQEAIKAATEKVAGKVVEAELEEKPRATWEVEVLTEDGQLMEVWVDVDTGAVVSLEEKQKEADGAAEKGKKERKEQREQERMRGGMGGMMHGGGMRHGGQQGEQGQ